MFRALMLAAILAVAIPATAQEPASTPTRSVQPIVIEDDDGGVIDTYVAFYERIAASGVPVRVDGICISACTLVLMLPPEQLCITDRTSFGFHAAWILEAAGHPKSVPSYTRALWRRFYPAAVREFLESLGAEALQPEPIYVGADKLVELGVRRCE